jgi:hypothetical protein
MAKTGQIKGIIPGWGMAMTAAEKAKRTRLGDMSLHVLDIAENSVRAFASRVRISIKEDSVNNWLGLSVLDDGRGIDLGKKTGDPFYTDKKGKMFGLGLPLLEQAARDCGGDFCISGGPGAGTAVEAGFRMDHTGIKPLGDMGSTMAALVAGHPGVDFMFFYEKDSSSYGFDTVELESKLNGVPVSAPEVLRFVRDGVNEGIRRIKG